MIKTYLQAIVPFVFLSVFSINLAAQRKNSRELDNKTYVITITDMKSSKSVQDEIVIKSDKIRSSFLADKFAFDPAKAEIIKDSAYVEKSSLGSEEEEVRVLELKAETSNDSGEQLSWTVTIEGYDIEGAAVISKKDKVKREYEFSGTEKVKIKKAKKE